jgi:hypothetical protein
MANPELNQDGTKRSWADIIRMPVNKHGADLQIT